MEDRMSFPTHPDYFYSSKLEGRFITATVLTFFATVACLLAITVWDSSGRKPHDHPEALPAKVEQLDPRTYLIADHSVQPTDICRGHGGGSDGQRLEVVKELPKISSQFVVCGHSQSWNDKRVKSLSFWGAAEHFIRWPLTIPAIVISLILFWQYPIRYRFAWNRAKAREAETQRQKNLQADEARLLHAAQQQIRFDRLKSELVAEWSKADSSVSDEDFERKLGELDARRERGEL
jgi:hypothetical protein